MQINTVFIKGDVFRTNQLVVVQNVCGQRVIYTRDPIENVVSFEMTDPKDIYLYTKVDGRLIGLDLTKCTICIVDLQSIVDDMDHMACEHECRIGDLVIVVRPCKKWLSVAAYRGKDELVHQYVNWSDKIPMMSMLMSWIHVYGL